MALTAKQLAALLEALRNNGKLFQLPESRRHSPKTLATLVKDGFLVRSQVGVIWTLTAKGRREVEVLK